MILLFRIPEEALILLFLIYVIVIDVFAIRSLKKYSNLTSGFSDINAPK